MDTDGHRSRGKGESRKSVESTEGRRRAGVLRFAAKAASFISPIRCPAIPKVDCKLRTLLARRGVAKRFGLRQPSAAFDRTRKKRQRAAAVQNASRTRLRVGRTARSASRRSPTMPSNLCPFLFICGGLFTPRFADTNPSPASDPPGCCGRARSLAAGVPC
jgi:hypothetical protein